MCYCLLPSGIFYSAADEIAVMPKIVQIGAGILKKWAFECSSLA